MKKNAAKGNKWMTKREIEKIRAEEKAQGIPEEFRTPKKMRLVPKDQRHQVPPEAIDDPSRTKVRITTYLDLDVLEYFKARAATNGTPYQTQINAELRSLMEQEQKASDAAAQLRQAKGLIDAAIRTIKSQEQATTGE